MVIKPNIEDNGALTSSVGLEKLMQVSGLLRIFSNNSLASLDGLDSIMTIGGGLDIRFNNILASIAALEMLTSVGETFTGDLIYEYNASLSNLVGLEGLSYIKGELRVVSNEALID